MLQGFSEAFRKLADMPGMGHLREELTDEPFRFWAVGSYLIIYRPDTDPVEILRVLHGSRDIAGLLDRSRSPLRATRWLMGRRKANRLPGPPVFPYTGGKGGAR
jgi:hypothetical protein